MRFPRITLLSVFLMLLTLRALGQSPNGNINGLVLDPTNRVIAGAEIVAVNDVTGVQFTTKTNDEGVYVLVNLPPGPYRLQVSKVGFKTIIKPDITLNVQDALSINFTLPIGALLETVTVAGGAPLVNTESATVSTLVDRQFAENLPMNGRSFQTLIQLTPGVVAVASNEYDGGQFSVSGQRPSSNYWLVDGVSANIGVSATAVPGNGFAGSLGSFSALGGTNSLVSIDAMQEFRIQTSTYAPEFGRTPGGQISIVTRSGTNRFHGTVFEYFRNDAMDSNDWFAGSAGLTKPEERQNDFGGTFDGPILKDNAFFFFSYEGLRLRLPQVGLTQVPDITARQNAISAMQPFLNAFPLPNGPDNVATGVAEFNASYSNAAALDAYSLRLDHRLNSKWTLFGRYNYSPSTLLQRANGNALSVVSPARIVTQTATVGTSWAASTSTINDLRFNYSKTSGVSTSRLDNFGGAMPLASIPLPSTYSDDNATFNLLNPLLLAGNLTQGRIARNIQRQLNLVDNVSLQKGSHSLKFGIDYRCLLPVFDPAKYVQAVLFLSVPSAEAGSPLVSTVQVGQGATLLLQNFGAFAQDTWRITHRATLTYGLRWDLDFAPSSATGPGLPAATGYSLSDLSKLALAPSGTAPFRTPYRNLAPRIGIAYQLSQTNNWQTVLRGGAGVFYDLATQEVGNLMGQASYPFGASKTNFPSGPFPLSASDAAPPPITPPNAENQGVLTAFDPHLRLPYALEWNFAVEQGVGSQQTVSGSYIGSVGRRLIQSAYLAAPNPNLGTADLVGNTASSNYNAFQLQFQRRLSQGLQALASYSWSHSIDDGSAGSFVGNPANNSVPSLGAAQNRGDSDFDIRSAFSAAITYDTPAPKLGALANAILRGWSFQSVIQARSAPPVNVHDSTVGFGYLLNAFVQVRPDVLPGIPLYLDGGKYPGGRAINNSVDPGHPGCKGPFCPPPTDPTTGAPLRQGNLSRNALRGFGAFQWDLAVHRTFSIRGPLQLQFRAEMFNVLNHPNFGQPITDIGNSRFGLSTQMLGKYLDGGTFGSTAASGAFNSLYQIGGPRSIQLALKLAF